jgi:FkbM family methyltransferase
MPTRADILEHLVVPEGADRLDRLLRGLDAGDALLRLHPVALGGAPIALRPLAEDARAFVDAMVRKRTSPAASLPAGGTALVIGAHIGLGCAALLAEDPRARVLAVEMDRACADLCARNLEPFGARAGVLCCAAWGVGGRVHVTGSCERTRRVAALDWYPGHHPERTAPTGLVEALSVPAIMDRLGLERASLLHLSVNGAEASLLDRVSPWLKRVDAAAVRVSPPSNPEQIRWRLSEQGMVVKADPRDASVLVALRRELAWSQPRFAVPMDRLEPAVGPG